MSAPWERNPDRLNDKIDREKILVLQRDERFFHYTARCVAARFDMADETRPKKFQTLIASKIPVIRQLMSRYRNTWRYHREKKWLQMMIGFVRVIDENPRSYSASSILRRATELGAQVH